MILEKLRQITVIGLGLLGSSITLAVNRCGIGIKTAGFSHRDSTRRRAKRLGVANIIYDDILQSVADADIVILATPICTFADIFKTIAPALKRGCIVTDVGSTKALVHKWAKQNLPRYVKYVGSHPIAGSEQRGVDFGRDDLFESTLCLLTKDKTTDLSALRTLKKFWTLIGCRVSIMEPREHDRTLGLVSHLPHALAASLLNACDLEKLKFCGKGFIDTTRIASGPANIWADIFFTNSENVCAGIEKVIKEMLRLKKMIKLKNKNGIEKLLRKAGEKRTKLMEYKLSNREIQ